MQTKQRFAFHPLLFAIYPVAFYYIHNIREVRFSETLGAFAFSILGTVMLYTILWRLLKNGAKAALVATIALFMFYSFKQFTDISFQLLGNTALAGIAKQRYFTTVWTLALLAFCAAATASRINYSAVTSILNLSSIVLIALPLFSIKTSLPAAVKEWNAGRLKKIELLSSAKPEKTRINPPPDIYYLIFDRFPNNKTLEQYFNSDVNHLITGLESKGFYVPEKSICNYPHTPLSIASLLNMEYIDLPENVKATNSYSPIKTMMQDSAARRFLLPYGYKWVNLGSKSLPTNYNPLAYYDKSNVRKGIINEFSLYVFNSTLAFPYWDKIFRIQKTNRLRMLQHIRDLEEMPTFIEGPKFVLFHALLPHPPVIFRYDGALLSNEELSALGAKKAFVGQVIYTSGKMLEIADELLSQYPENRKPIIVMQSDEGPLAHYYSLPDHKADIRCRNFSALYLPGLTESERKALPEDMSNVNTLRLIFNLYFGANYPLLENKCYFNEEISTGPKRNRTLNQYIFKDITRQIKW
ncbi:MAG: hypothetical protein WCX65_08155 [bacterium]